MTTARDSMSFRARLIRRVAMLCLAAIGIIALMAYLTWSGYREAIRGAEVTTRNYALVIEERLDATLRRADAHLEELARDVPLEALTPSAGPRFADRIDGMLAARLVNFPELSRLSVADAEGNVIYPADPPTNIADRAHFKALRDGPPNRLVFSEVVVSRTQGRSTVVIARAIRDSTGAFRGAVLALLDLDYFEHLFRSLDVGRRGNVAIYRSDNYSLVVRWPQLLASVNRQVAPGTVSRELVASGHRRATFEFVAAIDGTRRLLSTQVLETYPFFVGVGFALDDVLAAWRTRSFVVGAFGLVLLVLLAGLVWRLWRSEEKLVAAKTAADDANLSKSAFLANMSHELRTPLNAILGFSQLINSLLHGPTAGPRYAAYAGDILQAGNHLLALINNVLDLSKIEAGRFQLHEERLLIADLIEASLVLVRLQAEAKSVALADCVPLDVPAVQADETALRQILVNLLSNAIKFTPPGGRVEVSAASAPDGGVVLAVADTGIGMTAEEIAKATERFAQIDNPFTKRQGGSGLGLAISKRLAELLGASFAMESARGRGTTVRLTLPSSRVLASPAPARRPATEKAA